MKTLIKLGGTLLDDPRLRASIAAQLAAFSSPAVVVHGGGKQMTRYLSERGVESRFVDGLRVTTPEVVDALLKVFAGSVNKELVAALVAAGCSAVGLSGIDGALTEAEPLSEQLGAVGRITRVNAALLTALNAAGFLPVIACVAGDRHGNIYNVNADSMAVACAAGFAARRLLFLTDVDGVRLADGSVARSLTVAEAQRLIADGVATGGMQAKLNASCSALDQGVAEVIIAPGHADGVVARWHSGEGPGTRIVPGGAA